MNMFHQRDVGKVMGLALASSSIGGIIAPYLMGYILEVTKSFVPAYYACAAATFMCGVTSLILFVRERNELGDRERLRISAEKAEAAL